MSRALSTQTSAFSFMPASQAQAVAIPLTSITARRVQEPRHDWREALSQQLDTLCSLPIGWDGYMAPPVSYSNAYFAERLLASACPVNAPPPQIVPGPNGDLQIEWHNETSDIELHIRAPYNVDAWRMSPQTGEIGEQVHLKSDFILIANWLKEFSGDSVASLSSAA